MKITKSTIACCVLILTTTFTQAQVGIGTTTPNANAILDVASSTKGILLPRLTENQRNAISSPTEGLVIFNSNTGNLNIFSRSLRSIQIENLNYFTVYSSTGGEGAWQEFTPTISGGISKIILNQSNPHSSYATTDFEYGMRIYSGVTGTNGSQLNGGQLIGFASVVIPATGSTGINNMINTEYTFVSPIPVVANTKYWFQINKISSGGIYADTYLNPSDVYLNNASWIGGVNRDLNFKVYIKPEGPSIWKSLN